MIIVSLFHVGICWNSSLPREFPPCDESWHQLVPIQLGEDVSIGITLTEEMDESANHWTSRFVWTSQNEDVSACLEGICAGHMNARYVMKVNRKLAVGNYTYYVDMNILETISIDKGTYNLRSSHQVDCAIFTVHVYVDENQPICSALVPNQRSTIRLSCNWIPQTTNESVWLMAGTQLLQKYEDKGVMVQTNENDTFKTIAATIPIHYAFANNMSSFTCTVSTVYGQHMCWFRLFMLPKVNEIKEHGQEGFLSCCSSSKRKPAMRWYTKYNLQTLLTPSKNLFLLDVAGSVEGVKGPNENDETSIIFVCTKESDARSGLLGIGKLVLSLPSPGRVSLSIKLESNQTRQMGSQCLPKYTHRLSVIAERPVVAHIKQNKMTDKSCDSITLISVLVIVVVSLLFHIGLLIHQCFRETMRP